MCERAREREVLRSAPNYCTLLTTNLSPLAALDAAAQQTSFALFKPFFLLGTNIYSLERCEKDLATKCAIKMTFANLSAILLWQTSLTVCFPDFRDISKTVCYFNDKITLTLKIHAESLIPLLVAPNKIQLSVKFSV